MEITILLDEESKEPLYLQIYQYFKTEIQVGNISTGTRLPSIRRLSSHLKISKNTVELAYHQLLAEGYVESKPKSGLFVTEMDVDIFPKPIQKPLIKERTTNSDHIIYDFRYGKVDLEHFPYSTWRKLTNECLYPEDKSNLLYGDKQGEPDLRYEIAKYLHQSRGVNCSAKQIILGAGVQQLILLLCQLIGLNGQPIAFEEPGYDGVKMVFKNLGFPIKPIELEHDGIDLSKLKDSHAQTVYITPSHQFPCGMIMPVSKRMKLLQWAEENNGLIIEDDYDSEFRYIGRPIPSLQGFDLTGRVVYVGTFSKSLMPGLRMSYMVLPDHLLDRYHQDFFTYDQAVSKIHQKTMQLFMERGDWDRYIRKIRNVYIKKHNTLMTTINYEFKQNVEAIGNQSGLHILLQIKNGMSEEELIHAAEEYGVKVYPTSRYWSNPAKIDFPMIILGFGGLTEEQIAEGIKKLNKAWFNYE